MGLDNGITKRHKNEAINYLTDEVCYWRKWWGFRNDVVHYLCNKYDTDRETYEWELDKEDVLEIIDILKSWDNKEKWTMESRSVWHWDYDHVSNQIHHHITSLRKMLREVTNDDIVEFYDSY